MRARVAILGLVSLLALALPAGAGAQSGTEALVSLQGTNFAGETSIRITTRLNSGDPGQVLVAMEGGNVVVTDAGGPGVIPEASGPGLASCTGARDRAQVTCPAASVSQVNFTGGAANDSVDTTPSGLRLFANGGPGDDRLVVALNARGQSFLTGETGNDTLIGGNSQDFLDGDFRNSAGSDPGGNDTLIGNAGNDFLDGARGSDLLDGGAGIDSHTYSNTVAGVVVTTGDGLCNDGAPEDTAAVGTPPVQGCSANGVDRDLLRNVENVSGSRFPNDFTGSAASERFFTGNSPDRLEGGLGVDTLSGGNRDDLLISRDGLVDAAVQCGNQPTDRTVGDRAVADPDDVVDPSCVTIERGAFATPGPVGTPPGDPNAPPEFQPVPTAEILQGVPSNGAEGTQGGGGDGGKTPPELQITSPVATVTGAGVAELRVRCVYKAKNCVGTFALTAAKAAKAGKGKRKVSIKKGASLGKQTLDIPWGTSEPTRVKVSGNVRALFKAGANRLQATASVRAHDGAFPTGAEAKLTAPVSLGAGNRKR